MHITTANISQTMTNRTNIAIANSYEMAHGLSIDLVYACLGLGTSERVFCVIVSFHLPWSRDDQKGGDDQGSEGGGGEELRR